MENGTWRGGIWIGRKRRPFSWEELDKLCQLQCTTTEIAGWFETTAEALSRLTKKYFGLKLTEYWEQKRAGGQISLRRAQYQAAINGNVVMMIWLGKQMLGQRDRAEISLPAAKIELRYALDPQKPPAKPVSSIDVTEDA